MINFKAKGEKNHMTALRVEGTRVGWSFWLLWVLASTVGFGLGGAVGTLSFTMGGGLAVVGAVFGALFGAIGGIAQWLVMRQQVERAGWWIIATLGGWAVAGAVGGGVAQAAREVVGGGGVPQTISGGYAMGGLAFIVAFVAAGGILQWLVLRRQIVRASLWVALSTFGLFMGFVAGVFLGSTLSVIVSTAETSAIGTGMFGAGFGAGSGAITGAALVWLLRQPVPGAAKQMAAVS